MSETCPYCGEEYVGTLELYRHVLDYHGEAVLAYWIDEHDVTPPLSGQQSLSRVIA